MSNKVYNILKWVATVVLPACGTLYTALADTWGLPYGDQIATTIMAVVAFLGVVLGVSSNKYAKKQSQISGDTEEPIDNTEI